jgi:hypothetical protein
MVAKPDLAAFGLVCPVAPLSQAEGFFFFPKRELAYSKKPVALGATGFRENMNQYPAR